MPGRTEVRPTPRQGRRTSRRRGLLGAAPRWRARPDWQRLVARDDRASGPDPGSAASASVGGRPGLADAARVLRYAGSKRPPSRRRARVVPRARPGVASGPQQIRIARSAARSFSSSSSYRTSGAQPFCERGPTGRRSGRAPRPARHRGRDDVGVADRRERRRKPSSASESHLGKEGGVRVEARRSSLRECVCLLDRLGAGERGDDRPPAPRSRRSASSSASVPGHRREPRPDARSGSVMRSFA